MANAILITQFKIIFSLLPPKYTVGAPRDLKTQGGPSMPFDMTTFSIPVYEVAIL